MIAHNIEFTKRGASRMRIRAFFEKHSREARGSQELYWQHELAELDPKLSLRWNYPTQSYIVLYDHAGLLTVAWGFAPGDSFGLVLKNLKHKATLDARKLREMLKAERDGQEQFVTDQIADAGEEAGKDLHRMTTCKTTTDSVIDNDY